MSFALILISGNYTKPLTLSDINDVKNILSQNKISFDSEDWLCPKKVLEINGLKDISSDIIDYIRQLMDRREIDIFCIPSFNRRKKLLLADMDATIVEGETLDDLADRAGIKDKISSITERAMRGEIDFKAALTERVGMLKDLPLAAINETRNSIIINKGAQDVIRVMRQFGAECYLVSGGFTYFTEYIAQKCGFNGHHGNTLDIQNDHLTGKVLLPILDKDSKLSFLNHYMQKLGLSPADTMAVGDGANDIPMLSGAGLGVGYHPKPLVKEKINNYIIHTDLTSLLYIQGYTWQNIAT